MLKKHIGFKHLKKYLVVLNTLTSEYYILQGVESLIFSELTRNKTDDEVIQEILNKFKVSKEIATKDFHDFKQQLLNSKIIAGDN